MQKVPIALVSQLRKQTQVSINKAKEALLASDLNLEKALEWLDKDSAQSGWKKAEKMQTRIASEGLIAMAADPFGRRAGLVELNCETDFVGRSELFSHLALRIANTHLFVNPQNSLQALLEAPLFPLDSSDTSAQSLESTVQQQIIASVGKCGENIQLRRCESFGDFETQSNTVINGYIHTAADSAYDRIGRIGALVKIETDTQLSSLDRAECVGLCKKLAQHVVGFHPLRLSSASPDQDETSLLKQHFLMGGGTIENVLDSYSKKWNTKL